MSGSSADMIDRLAIKAPTGRMKIVAGGPQLSGLPVSPQWTGTCDGSLGYRETEIAMAMMAATADTLSNFKLLPPHYSNRTLIDCPLFIRLIVSASNGAIDSTTVFYLACGLAFFWPEPMRLGVVDIVELLGVCSTGCLNRHTIRLQEEVSSLASDGPSWQPHLHPMHKVKGERTHHKKTRAGSFLA